MSGRGKGGKGLGAYHRTIQKEETMPLFYRILPKKFHSLVKKNKFYFSEPQVEKWLNDIFTGRPWEVRTVKEQIAPHLETEPEKIRFLKVNDNKALYEELTTIHKTMRDTRWRKRRVLKDLVQVPEVKYGIGAPEYQKALQDFMASSKKLKSK